MSTMRDYGISKVLREKKNANKHKECISEIDREDIRSPQQISNMKKEELTSLKTALTFEIAQVYCKLEACPLADLDCTLRNPLTVKRLIDELRSSISENFEISKNQRELQQSIFENELRHQIYLKTQRDVSSNMMGGSFDSGEQRELSKRLKYMCDRSSQQISEGLDLLERLPKMLAHDQLLCEVQEKSGKLISVEKVLSEIKLNKKIGKSLQAIEELKKNCSEKDVQLNSFQKAFELILKELPLSDNSRKTNISDVSHVNRRSNSRLKHFLRHNTHNSLTPNSAHNTHKHTSCQHIIGCEAPGKSFSAVKSKRFSSQISRNKTNTAEKLPYTIENEFSDQKILEASEPSSILQEGDFCCKKMTPFRDTVVENTHLNTSFTTPAACPDRNSIRIEYPMNASINFNENPLNPTKNAKSDISPYKSPARRDFLNDLESSQNMYQAKLYIDRDLDVCSSGAKSTEKELRIGRSGFSLGRSQEDVSTCAQNSQVIKQQKQFPDISYGNFNLN